MASDLSTVRGLIKDLIAGSDVFQAATGAADATAAEAFVHTSEVQSLDDTDMPCALIHLPESIERRHVAVGLHMLTGSWEITFFDYIPKAQIDTSGEIVDWETVQDDFMDYTDAVVKEMMQDSENEGLVIRSCTPSGPPEYSTVKRRRFFGLLADTTTKAIMAHSFILEHGLETGG